MNDINAYVIVDPDPTVRFVPRSNKMSAEKTTMNNKVSPICREMLDAGAFANFPGLHPGLIASLKKAGQLQTQTRRSSDRKSPGRRQKTRMSARRKASDHG